MQRFTFVVQVHPEGITTLENLTTTERRHIGEMSEVGPQIERWVDELSPGSNRTEAPTEPAPG
jgi:hypothetical protein